MTETLLGWYAENARDLPFRHTRDPYAIWISEIMAQQTRIAALLPYYKRFMADFPTVQALAAASEDEVLARWAGLGYYARARALHKAARQMAQNGVPRNGAGWKALPGVGDYTASAVASIALGEKAAAVDGNVLRVFARLTGWDSDIAQTESKQAARRWVLERMDESNGWPGDLTQALMEFGALVCTPESPDCGRCPLHGDCASRRQGKTGILPVKGPPKEKRVERRNVLVILDDEGRVLLRRRTERLLHRLYEFPAASDITPLSVMPLGEAAHVFTHIRWEMRGELWRAANQPAPDGCVWVSKKEWDQYAVPSAFRVFTERLMQEQDFLDCALDEILPLGRQDC